MKTLKKISFGAFAFILGLTLVLTQSAFKGSPLKTMKRAPLTVYYHGPDFSQSEVENVANWTTANNSESCDNTNVVPCRIEIDEAYISAGQLQSSANLVAAENALTGTFYIQSSADNAMTRSNKSQ